VRADFLLCLIALLPAECGVTVFHDPAQAIYDYALADDGGTRVVEAVGGREGWRSGSLRTIYRTEDPALLKLYEELRLDILGNTDVGPETFASRADIVRRAAASVDDARFDHKKLGDAANALVLFRKRVEVVQASAFMAGDRAPHRLRMSGLPRTIRPWIGAAFCGVLKRGIERSEFDELVGQALAAGAAADGALTDFGSLQWDTLSRCGLVQRGTLDLWRFRDRLHDNPPDEFTSMELGSSGPILGTIHASKGREADHVILQINRHWCSSSDPQTDHDEEARVLFVGATRARQKLEVQGGLALQYASATDNGRSYRRSRRHRSGVQVQIGLKDDYDPYSILATQRGFEFSDLLAEKEPLQCSAVQQQGTWEFRISDFKGRYLGSFSNSLNSGFFEICRKVNGIGRKPPDTIPYLYVLGWSTAVAPTSAAQRLASIGTNAARSGFWIAPQIVGFPTVFCRW
jgi:hypothetical protein